MKATDGQDFLVRRRHCLGDAGVLVDDQQIIGFLDDNPDPAHRMGRATARRVIAGNLEGHATRQAGNVDEDVDTMDREMIAAWNAVVGPRDVVFHLGDFAHCADPERLRKIFHQLNGKKHLVLGNHDRQHTKDLPWISQSEMLHITVDDTRLHLCHYGLRTWPGIWRGAVQLYGHSHGRLPGNNRSMDVGVDAVGYFPLTVEHIKQHLQKLPDMVYPEELDEGEEFEVPVP